MSLDDVGTPAFKPYVDRGLRWMVTPDGPGIRKFILDCYHATTELRLYRDDPRDDVVVLSNLVTRHQQAYNQSPDSTEEFCGCEPTKIH
jgi:hypothetical protein